MTATPDIFARVHFSNGEALDPTDLENIGAFAQMLALDRLVGASVPAIRSSLLSVESAIEPHSLPFLLAAKPGQASLVQGSANNKIKITKGTVFQAIANVDGATPAILAYTFPGTDEVTIANAAGATPRVDLIQVALSQVDDSNETRDFEDATTREITSTTTAKRHRTACTITVKQGTPNASPTVPTLDAGCVAIATVVVGASYAAASGFLYDDTAGANAVIHDQRMPIGVRPGQIVQAANGANYPGANFTADPAGQTLQCTTPSTMWFPCLEGDTAGRVIAASTVGNFTVTQNCRFYRIFAGPGGFGYGSNSLNESNMNGSGGSVLKRRSVVSGIFETHHTPGAGPTVQASADGVGVPIWSNGHRGWVDPFDVTLDYQTLSTVALLYNGAAMGVGDLFYRAQFWIAG